MAGQKQYSWYERKRKIIIAALVPTKAPSTKCSSHIIIKDPGSILALQSQEFSGDCFFIAPKSRLYYCTPIFVLCLCQGLKYLHMRKWDSKKINHILFLVTCYYLSYHIYWAFTQALYIHHLWILQPYYKTGIIRNYFILLQKNLGHRQ